ncbi:peptidase M14 [Aliidiomarina halalkaliphila]|uniref:Peptidase M14 n=1 Tax=Aliidiomarina halalkaliphila TaxID=2593535 RepID=A0A552X3Q9_9GAMM|nr:M14 family metallopeptidase [Aliidiomarina halalkaliphila]TRW49678.1 peptidase M14 [Aliidiomarina halalkaliphila]
MKRTLLALCIAGAMTTSTLAAEPTVPQWPNSNYQDTPTVEQVLGYPAGARISSPEQIRHYFDALVDAHPDRIQLVEYGETWQGRSLFYVAISSAENIQRLDDIEANMRRLADPRELNDRQARELMQDLPSSVWIANSVHGNEISPAESSMVTAWHLLADSSDDTRALLSNTIVYLDPLQNPDGRARFVSRYYATIGMEPSDDRLSAEHNEPWPNGRTNHYLFDMNRDWLALTQPETRGRIAALLQTFPLIFVDSHEMGGDLPYYFTPEAHPFNPFITSEQREGLNWIGENNAKHFDNFGYDYFTREIFDAFYPGYGASWPLYHGSLASTYEMGSARGHHFRTNEGEILTYADGVQQNFVAFMATIETASKRREALLQRFYDYRKSGIEKGRRGDTRSYIFPNTRDQAGNQKLVAVLAEQGIEVGQATADFRACGSQYQQGAFVVQASQPAYHLIRTLLDSHVPMDQDFLEEQERLRANNLRDQIYDVTAWSLPLMFNVDMTVCNQQPRVATQAVGPERILPGTVTNADAGFGFAVAWGDMNTGRFLTAALRDGLLVRSSDLEFKHASGQTFPAGSLIVPRAGNPDDLSQRVAALAEQSGATVVGLERSWMQDGPNVGSVNVKRMHAPNIAMLWDQPTNVLSAGSTRYIIEREFNYPVTAIRPAQLQRADLSRYQVLILPATAQGSYEQALGDAGRENLRQWVQRGGVLITLGNATRFAVSGENPLLASALERKAQVDDLAPRANGQRVDGVLISDEEDHQRYIRDPKSDPDWVSGVITRTSVDQEHWLTAGIHSRLYAMFIGSDIYAPLRISDGRNVVNYAGKDDLLASGYMWAENIEQVAYKPYLMVQPQGRGMVISFTQEPNFRAYLDGQHVLLMNAIFRGAAHANPVR